MVRNFQKVFTISQNMAEIPIGHVTMPDISIKVYDL